MAEKRRGSSGPEAANRSRAAEFPPAKPDTTKTVAATADSGKVGVEAPAAPQPKRKESGGTAGPGARSAQQPGTAATGDKPASPGASGSGKSENGKPAVRGLATEVPVKTVQPAEQSEYVVTINHKSGHVRIDRFVVATAGRQPLSPSEHASVAVQLSTAATRPLAAAMSAQAGPALPPMLNAPAFNALVARSAAASPVLSQIARSAAAPRVMEAAGEPSAAPPATGPGGSAPADTTAVMQAYLQGALDYLKALANDPVTGR